MGSDTYRDASEKPGVRPHVVHFDIAAQFAVRPRVAPLIGQTAMHGLGPTRGFYTLDATRVTCKKCMRTLASQAN